MDKVIESLVEKKFTFRGAEQEQTAGPPALRLR